jgi:hypothetical protein
MRTTKLPFYIFSLWLILQFLPIIYRESTDLATLESYGNMRFTCTYSGLWCSCYTNNQGGCSVGCSPNAYLTLHNQTGCPQRKNFFLAGMSPTQF